MSEQDTIEVHDYGTFTYEDNNEPLQYFPVVVRVPMFQCFANEIFDCV